MAVKQVSVFIENQTGRLSELTGILADHGIDLNAATIAETGEYGILRSIVQNPEETVRVLSSNGFMASVTEVLAVGIENRPGGLDRVLKLLSGGGIDVKYIYSTIQSIKGEAVIMMKTSDQAKATEILSAAGVKLCEMEELK